MLREEDVQKIFKEYLFDNWTFDLQNPRPLSKEDKKVLENISANIKKKFPNKHYEPGLIIYALLNISLHEGDPLNKTIYLRKVEITYDFCQRLATSDSKFACSFRKLEAKHGVYIDGSPTPTKEVVADSKDKNDQATNHKKRMNSEVVVESNDSKDKNDQATNSKKSLTLEEWKKRNAEKEEQGKAKIEEEISKLEDEINGNIDDLLETTDEEKIIHTTRRSKSVAPKVRFEEKTNEDRYERQRRRSWDREEEDKKRKSMNREEDDRRKRPRETEKAQEDKEEDDKRRNDMEWNEGEYRSRRQKEMEKAREDMEQVLRRHLGCDLRLISNFMFKYQHITNSQDNNKYRRIKAAIFRIREDLHESYY